MRGLPRLAGSELGLLGQLLVLRAHIALARTARAILAARDATGHVELATGHGHSAALIGGRAAGRASDAVSRRRRTGHESAQAIGEDAGGVVDESVEGMW